MKQTNKFNSAIPSDIVHPALGRSTRRRDFSVRETLNNVSMFRRSGREPIWMASKMDHHLLFTPVCSAAIITSVQEIRPLSMWESSAFPAPRTAGQPFFPGPDQAEIHWSHTSKVFFRHWSWISELPRKYVPFLSNPS